MPPSLLVLVVTAMVAAGPPGLVAADFVTVGTGLAPLWSRFTGDRFGWLAALACRWAGRSTRGCCRHRRQGRWGGHGRRRRRGRRIGAARRRRLPLPRSRVSRSWRGNGRGGCGGAVVSATAVSATVIGRLGGVARGGAGGRVRTQRPDRTTCRPPACEHHGN
ncbi:MAG: hypothetical protein ACRDPT_12170 [Streptomycetales bacterium]